MLVKSQVKYIQSLGHKKFRDADGVFVAEGPKIVSEMLEARNVTMVQLFALSGWLQQNEQILAARQGAIHPVDDHDLERISGHAAPNQVVAVFTRPVFTGTHDKGITLLLDSVQDPGNLGTILRTADWFGVRRIICSKTSADIFSAKVVQAAMGSLVRVEVLYKDLDAHIEESQGVPVFSGSLQGEDLLQNIQVKEAILIMGNESKGISESLEARSTRRLRIPGKGGAESLNVAVATGILLSRIEVS